MLILDIGGEYNCQAANFTDAIFIARWPDLQSMSEFRNEIDSGNSTIIPTTNDLVVLWIQYLQNPIGASQVKLENTTDVDESTKIVNMTFRAEREVCVSLRRD